MLPLQYEELVREYRRADLLHEAARQRLAVYAYAGRAQRAPRKATQSVVCHLRLPVLESVCAAQPA